VNRILKSLVAIWLVCGLIFVHIGFAAESTHWERFDEREDLALLAEHSNESMHFRLLQSQITDKNLWWQPFLDDLETFSEARYTALKPLVLDQAISSLQRSVAAGEFSYEELTLFYLFRIREIETDGARYLNAVISVNPSALAAARRADAERASGRSIDENSVFGMPVLLKDNIGSAGMATTAGAVVLQHNVTGDAFITEQLLAAGAVILGKANLSEWAYFFCEECPSGYSALGGQTLNPYGRFAFGTGGSSSGSGAAAAANLAAATVGSETSGSILSPASSNSVVGLKPTTGSLSRSGIVPISSTLDTAGPITRYVADAVALFNAMAGYDEADAAMPLISADFQLEIRDVPLAGKRLGVLEDYVDDELFQASLRLLSNQDASLIEMRLPEFDSSGFGELLGGEMLLDLASYLDTWAHEDVSVSSVADVQAANNTDPEFNAPYGQALFDMMAELSLSDSELSTLRERLQSGARAALDSLFENHRLDVLLSINNRNAGIAALANYPALTIPMGYQEDGRPMGLTLIAPPFNEQELIDIGLQFERLSSARRVPDAYR
jgi:amidase